MNRPQTTGFPHATSWSTRWSCQSGRWAPPVARSFPAAPTEGGAGVNTTCGASNVSFGLPNRHAVTGTFLSMAMANGMTSAIMSPLHDEVKSRSMAANVLMGNDQDCAAWIRANRDPNAPTGAGGARRRGGRRPRG